LTKTHVEAPTGFSIFLSGFLVKSAIYGFYRLTGVLGGHTEIVFSSVICFLGVLDASIKMWHQSDLKKLVAYGTVQEMNLIYLMFCFGDSVFVIGGIFFCITHAFLSGLFFYLVDCVHRRYMTRSIAEISGVLHTTPNLGLCILLGLILYSGFPGTLKFVSELYVFTSLFEGFTLSLILLIYGANFLGILGFSKCWFNVVFGATVIDGGDIPDDLTNKEFLIIFLCLAFLFGFQISLNLFF